MLLKDTETSDLSAASARSAKICLYPFLKGVVVNGYKRYIHIYVDQVSKDVIENKGGGSGGNLFGFTINSM